MLDALIAEQQRLELTDKDFAALLGLYRTTWNRIRHNRYPLPPRTVQRAVRAFPNLQESATLFLFPRETGITNGAHKPRRRKEPSNIDIEATERTHTLVLTNDHATLACPGAAPTGQGKGGSRAVQSVLRTAGSRYIMSDSDASALASRAADAAEAS